MRHSFEPGNKNNIPKRIMQQEEEPTSTEVPWRRSDCYSMCVCVCLRASTSVLCVSVCAGYVHMLVLQRRNESHTLTHTHTHTERESHIISAGSPQQHIPQILLHISKEHNVLLLSGATLISRGGGRLLLFFSTFFFFFFFTPLFTHSPLPLLLIAPAFKHLPP